MLGHRDLPQFVRDMSKALYRPAQDQPVACNTILGIGGHEIATLRAYQLVLPRICGLFSSTVQR